MNEINLNEMSGPELVAWYNSHAVKQVKRFATRADGIKRCSELLEAMRFDVEPVEQEIKPMTEQVEVVRKTPEEIHANRSAGAKASWQDPEIAALRSARMKCFVPQTNTVYGSVPKAFAELGLDMRKFNRVRGEMRENGEAEYGGFTFRWHKDA